MLRLHTWNDSKRKEDISSPHCYDDGGQGFSHDVPLFIMHCNAKQKCKQENDKQDVNLVISYLFLQQIRYTYTYKLTVHVLLMDFGFVKSLLHQFSYSQTTIYIKKEGKSKYLFCNILQRPFAKTFNICSTTEYKIQIKCNAKKCLIHNSVCFPTGVVMPLSCAKEASTFFPSLAFYWLLFCVLLYCLLYCYVKTTTNPHHRVPKSHVALSPSLCECNKQPYGQNALVKPPPSQTFLIKKAKAQIHWIGLSGLETEGQWIWVAKHSYQ